MTLILSRALVLKMSKNKKGRRQERQRFLMKLILKVRANGLSRIFDY
jgi:hypothetical protein